LISNFRVLNVVCFLLGDFLAYEFIRRFGTLSVPSSYLTRKMEQAVCSKTLAYKIHTLGDHPEESIPKKPFCQ